MTLQDFIESWLVPAIGSAVIWSSVWIFSFFVLTVVLFNMNIPTKTSALIITLTLVSAHITKYVSYLANTDTDFRKTKKWTMKDLHGWRLLFTTMFLLAVIVIIFSPRYGVNLANEFEPASLPEFADSTRKNINVCILLFSLQMVFSWPEVKILSGQPI